MIIKKLREILPHFTLTLDKLQLFNALVDLDHNSYDSKLYEFNKKIKYGKS